MNGNKVTFFQVISALNKHYIFLNIMQKVSLYKPEGTS